MKTDRITKQSKFMPLVFITTYTDKSGGYFSLADLKPEPLVYLVACPLMCTELNNEFNQQLNKQD
jgi:hypothetical protein